MLLVRFRINFLTGMPGFVRNKFLKKALEMKKVMQGIQFPEYMALNLGGEKIMPKARNEMREMLHELGVKEARITGAWGCSETRFNLLGECDCFQETGYHSTGWDKVAYRIVKMKSPDDWEFAAPGEEGFVVQFPMDGAGTIIEGFILGDMAVQLDGPCPVCGSYVERFVNPLRANELDTQLMIMGLVEQKVKGASVNLTDLRGQLLEIPELQIVVTKKDPADPGSEDLLVLNVALKKMPGIDESAVKAALASRAKALSEITPEVVLMGMDELMGEGLKFKVIVDRRP
jgi:phenylacetate-coenzyme A ligase PaaK-like adenylate-forming protein